MAPVRVLLIVSAVGGLTAWAVAQGTSLTAGPRASAVPLAAARQGGEQDGAPAARDPGLEVEISRLTAGLGVMPAPSSGRNPFRFGATASRRAAVTPAHRPTGIAPGANHDPAADRPPMQLLGVASDGSGGDRVRTAVITTPRQLYLVREGEQIAYRFQVVRISEDAVELRDLATDETFPLALR